MYRKDNMQDSRYWKAETWQLGEGIRGRTDMTRPLEQVSKDRTAGGGGASMLGQASWNWQLEQDSPDWTVWTGKPEKNSQE